MFRLWLLVGLLGLAFRLAATPVAAPASDSAASWRRLKLTGWGSVEMPAPAVPIALAKSQAYTGTTEQAVCVAVAVQVDSAEFSPANGYLNEAELNELYNHSLQSFLAQQVHARLVSRASFTAKGRRGIEVRLAVPATGQLGTSEIMRILYCRPYIYLLTWRDTAGNSTAGVADKLRFFNSLQVASKPLSDAELDSIGAYRLRHLVGRVLLYGGVLIIIALLLRRFQSASRKRQS